VRVIRNCTWNRCTFCPVYKGTKASLRPLEDALHALGLSVNTATLGLHLFATERLRTLGQTVADLSGLDGLEPVQDLSLAPYLASRLSSLTPDLVLLTTAPADAERVARTTEAIIGVATPGAGRPPGADPLAGPVALVVDDGPAAGRLLDLALHLAAGHLGPLQRGGRIDGHRDRSQQLDRGEDGEKVGDARGYDESTVTMTKAFLLQR